MIRRWSKTTRPCAACRDSVAFGLRPGHRLLAAYLDPVLDRVASLGGPHPRLPPVQRGPSPHERFDLAPPGQAFGPPQSWLGGLIFVVHPLVVESVAWISEIKNTLSLPFFSPFPDRLHRCVDRGGRKRLRARASFICSRCCAKARGFMLPVVLLLYQWWRHGRITWLDVRRMLPYFAIALALGSVTLYFQASHYTESDVVRDRGTLTRLIGAGAAIFFYLGKFIFPVDLLPIYPRWNLEPPSLSRLLTLPLLALTLAALWTKRATWGRHALLGVGFFLINLLPVIGLCRMTKSSKRCTRAATTPAHLPPANRRPWPVQATCGTTVVAPAGPPEKVLERPHPGRGARTLRPFQGRRLECPYRLVTTASQSYHRLICFSSSGMVRYGQNRKCPIPLPPRRPHAPGSAARPSSPVNRPDAGPSGYRGQAAARRRGARKPRAIP